MRGRKLILAAAACTALAAGCAEKAPEAPAIDLAAEAQAVRDRSAAWLQLAVAKDVAGVVNGIFTPDAVTLSDGKVRKGTAEIQAGFEADIAAAPNASITWTTSSVKVADSGDLAYELGSFTFDPDGADSKPAVTGEFVTVWSKVDGTWRAVVDSGTEIKPAETPTQ